MKWFVLILTLLWLGACSSPNTPKPNNPGQPEPIDDATELDCEVNKFACSGEEVSDQVFERSLALFNEAKGRLSGGESFDAVKVWLESQEDMHMVLASEFALMFIVKDSVPFTIYDAIAATGRDNPNYQPLEEGLVLPQNVVGHGTNREDFKNHKKRALVLSPFEWEYKTPDAGKDVANLLSDIPDYRGGEGGVDYFENEDVTVERFTNWDYYDVILVNTHGGTMQGKDANGKVIRSSFLTTGIESDCTQEALARGVWCIGVNVRDFNLVLDPVDEYRTYLVVDPRLFKDTYPTGLAKSVVVFNACLSAITDFFAKLLIGDSSVVFGWDDNVEANFNTQTTIKLFEDFASGLDSKSVYDKRCKQGCVDPAKYKAALKYFGSTSALRIREIVAAKAEVGAIAGALATIQDGDNLKIIGVPGDGKKDKLELVAEVTGVVDPDAPGGPVSIMQTTNPAELYHLRFLIDGVDIGFDNLGNPQNPTATVTQIDDLTYRYRYTADLPFDVSEAGKNVELKIEVDLPDEGKSFFTADVSLSGTSAWRMTVSGRYFSGTYEGDEATVSEAYGVLLSGYQADMDFTIIAQSVLASKLPPGDSSQSPGNSSVDFVNLTKTPPMNLTLFDGDGISTISQPDGSQLPHPKPATVDFFGFDKTQDTIQGAIQGTYIGCYTSYVDPPGPEGYCDYYDVSIEFSAENQFVYTMP